MDRLRDSLADVPIVAFDEYRYFVHPITDGIPEIEPALLRDVANEIVRRVDFDGVDRIVAPQSMGIHIGTAVSLQTDVPLTIARKRSYGLEGEVSVAQVTGYDENELFLNGVTADDTVVVVDDVISTGGTQRALLSALAETGAEVRRFVAVFDKREDPTDPGFPLEDATALLTVALDGDSVVEVSDVGINGE